MKPTKACLVRRTWKPFYAMAKCASEMSISELIEARENVGRFLGPLIKHELEQRARTVTL